MPCTTDSQEEGDRLCRDTNLDTIGPQCIISAFSPAFPSVSRLSSLDVPCSDTMLVLVSLLFTGLDCLLAAPAGREVYRMPQSALKALSDRGTVVLEAAMTSALSALDRASSERSRAEVGCRGCTPCLFQDCGQPSGSCSSPANAISEPSCDIINKAQKLQDEAERSWALSQACAFYQHRCQAGNLDKDSCIRIMAVCGQRSSSVHNVTRPRSRIVGGSPAPPGSWPWLVNLQLDGGLMCGGVLVESSWVVTAAHCFAGSRSESYWTAVVGEFDITKTDPDEQILKVNRIIPHPKFNPKTFNNDIALVELTSPVVLSDRVTPVCLPSGMEPPTGSPCLVAGWGSLYEDGPSADVVMEAKVPLLPQTTCKNALGKELVTNTMLCAGYLSGGIDSCQGDSGGPLIYQDRLSGRFQLHGITSWGDGCGEKGKPGVYTRVSAFSDWIQAEIQKSFGSREPTCPELLKTTEMTEEEQRSEFSTLCRFYTLTCLPGQSTSACSRMAEDKCLTRFKKCQLRSFLQTLLDLLQRAEDYIRDKVDLTFFTQTLPQLVEHIHNTAFTHTRDRRDVDGNHFVQIKEQLGGAVTPAEYGPPPLPPALFKELGPLVEDWENYLTNMAEDMEKQPKDTSTDTSFTSPRQEEKLFSQAGDNAVLQLEKEYQDIISALRSKLESKAAPPILHLDPSFLQESSSNPPLHPTSFTSAQVNISPSSSQKSQESQSILAALMTEIQKLRMQSGTVTSDETQSGTFFTLVTSDETDLGELQASVFPAQRQSTTVVPPTTGDLTKTTSQPRQTLHGSNPLSLHRKKRSLLYKRQTPGSGGKICPGVRETSQQVSQVRESYRWVLSIPNTSLCMNFQEVLVDLSSKNNRGLYQARIRATVAGRPLTFYSLIGLGNESFYRSVPRIISLALEALKT
ncbi:serine protease 56 isoform X2 [Dunckerocampus dactyliophorus]|uniref:serine protease 56 isoform X2 n=1 Tax=Dunckerocampus dactyliophorus TaxID=161453 RepID=UPI002405EE4F|nr:serine protease 56 isoform X2 [Dunckerocampus dactyliophorus]